MTWKTKYAKIANRIYDSLERAKTYDGLLPVYLDVWKGEPRGHQYSIGGMSDSYYEYLLKGYMLMNDRQLYDMFMNLYYAFDVYNKAVRLLRAAHE